jgi:alpha-tubulin suppressor-like RCC1 family protein
LQSWIPREIHAKARRVVFGGFGGAETAARREGRGRLRKIGGPLDDKSAPHRFRKDGIGVAAKGGMPKSTTPRHAIWFPALLLSTLAPLGCANEGGAGMNDPLPGTGGAPGTGGTSVSSLPPEAVTPMVAAGNEFSLAVTRSGKVFAWGFEDNGRLGTGRTGFNWDRHPTAVPGLDHIVRVAAGREHALALRSDGVVFAWGQNNSGQLGLGQAGASVLRAQQVPGLTNIKDIVTASWQANVSEPVFSFSLALHADGTVYAWGDGRGGQLGLGDAAIHPSPTQIPGLTDVVALAAGGVHALALRGDGTVWAWGFNDYGELGIGRMSDPVVSPTQVMALANEKVIAVAAGDMHSLALTQSGALYGWGGSTHGQAGAPSPGEGQFGQIYTPMPIASDTDIVGLSAGARHSLALMKDGSVRAFGSNSDGQLGNGRRGSSTSTHLPQVVGRATAIVAMAAGVNHNLLIDQNDQVLCFGSDWHDQCGRADTNELVAATSVGPGFSVGQ